MAEKCEKSPPKKKKSYYCSFQDAWLQDPSYKTWLKKIDNFSGACSKCNNVTFTIKHDGEKAVRKHLLSDHHKKTMKIIGANKLVETFLTVKGILKKSTNKKIIKNK